MSLWCKIFGHRYEPLFSCWENVQWREGMLKGPGWYQDGFHCTRCAKRSVFGLTGLDEQEAEPSGDS